MFTVYLWTAERLTIRNLELLHALARAVYLLRLPYVIVGDWNLAPGLLCSSGFVGWVGGVVRAPEKSTFVLGDAASVIDYFVIAQELGWGCHSRP